MKRLSGAIALVLLLSTSTTAHAQRALEGPYKFDMKIGPAIGVIDHGGNQFHLGLGFGIDLTPHLAHHIYLDLPLAFNFGDGTDIMILPGIEADILLPVGQPIYIYPMFGMGPFIFVPSCPFGRCDSEVGFGFRLGVGIKYVLDGRWNFFFEPFSLEIYPIGFDGGTPGHYNMLFGAGINF